MRWRRRRKTTGGSGREAVAEIASSLNRRREGCLEVLVLCIFPFPSPASLADRLIPIPAAYLKRLANRLASPLRSASSYSFLFLIRSSSETSIAPFASDRRVSIRASSTVDEGIIRLIVTFVIIVVVFAVVGVVVVA
jgi:hypothetical protein